MGGGAVRAFFGGGQSRDIFRGGPVKKITLYMLFFQIVFYTIFFTNHDTLQIIHLFGFAFLGFSRLLDDHGTLDPRAEGLIGEGRNDLKLKQRVANKSSRRDRNFITTPTSFPSSQKIGILFLCSPT